jgi:hypothetical protein
MPKHTPPLVREFAVTTTFPEVAPEGTVTPMAVSVQLVGVALTPLNLTVPCVVPKRTPLIVTAVPVEPELGDKPLMAGGLAVTVNSTALLAWPPTVITTFPVVANAGTGTVMLVSLQLVGTELTPLKVIEEVPCVAPKLAPKIVTDVVPAPLGGKILAMNGVGLGTVNRTPLLAMEFAVTTMLPVDAPIGTCTVMLVSLQLVGVLALLLNVTEPAVCPKPVPVMVTEVPVFPECGEKVVMLGGVPTAKNPTAFPPPDTPTLSGPVVAPTGTGTTI